jgi:DNA-binding NarL/FixJ family response regulator
MTPTSILLVDDHLTFLRLTTCFLQQFNDLIVVATAHEGEDALAKAAALQPHLVLLDLAMPGLSGLEVIPRLRSVLPQVGIIVLTKHRLASYQKAALMAGADEFVSKATMGDDLLPAIQRVIRTNRFHQYPDPKGLLREDP